MVMRLSVVKSVLSGKYRIADLVSGKYLADLDKEEFLDQLKMFTGELPYNKVYLPQTKSLTAFYDIETGNIEIGRIRFTKKGKLDRRYVRSTFVKQGKNFDEVERILKEELSDCEC